MSDEDIYCPRCGRGIKPLNEEQVASGEDNCYIYVHDDVVHEEDDIEALQFGIN